MKKTVALLLALALLLAAMPCALAAESANSGRSRKQTKSALPSAIEQLHDLGLDFTTDELAAMEAEYHCKADALSLTDLLIMMGLGHYDYDSGEWTPFTHIVYSFDAEIFDIENMYTLFLQGVQAVVPGITITDIREDLSGTTEEMTDPEDGLHPPTDGMRSVSFLCNGHSYSVELASYGDWFNEDMFDFMDEVLAKENCPLVLYEFLGEMQYNICVYTTPETAEQLNALIRPY